MNLKLIGLLFLFGGGVLFSSCGGDDNKCVTCTFDGNDDETICEDDFTSIPGLSKSTQLDTWREGFEALGYDCN